MSTVCTFLEYFRLLWIFKYKYIGIKICNMFSILSQFSALPISWLWMWKESKFSNKSPIVQKPSDCPELLGPKNVCLWYVFRFFGSKLEHSNLQYIELTVGNIHKSGQKRTSLCRFDDAWPISSREFLTLGDIQTPTLKRGWLNPTAFN